MEQHKENPKLIQAMKDGKAPLEYLIDSVMEGDAYVHKGGADKYGIRNWLIDKIKASTYKAAIRRHLKAWSEGEDIDPDSGWSHLYHIRASCAIVLDADKHGTLIDDRDFCESLSNKQDAGSESKADATFEAQHVPDAALNLSRTRKWVCPPELTLNQPHYVSYHQSYKGNVINVISKGPFPDWWRAKEYVRDNPQNIAGKVSIHTLNRP